MPDVKLPDGTIIKNVPEGTTQSELMRRLGSAQSPRQQFVGPPGPIFPSQLDVDLSKGMFLGKVETPEDVRRGDMAETAASAAAAEREVPMLDRFGFQQRAKVPLLATLGSLLVPGSGWGALGLQALAGAAGGTTGEMLRQKEAGETVDVGSAAKVGAEAGATGLAAGGALKLLGAAAKAAFSTPLGDEAKAAAQFAREQGAPFPLSSAAPGTGASRTQTASRLLLPGEIRTQVDANKVSQFINRQVGSIVDRASPVDEAALKGQQYLRQVFEPGETIYTQTFKDLRSTLGDETPVPLTETRKVLDGVSEALKQRGEMKAVFNRVRNIQKGGATEQTVAQLDELYSGLLKDTARNANARREANVVLSAIGKDIDNVLEGTGSESFSETIGKAKAVRDEFRDLRNIPQLERLSQPFGERGGTLGSRQWMAEMFSNPNGKALGELRTRNPELYHELADSYLASNINRFSKPVKDGIGRALDGPALRAWYEQNEPTIKLIYGAPQAKALDNFSLYAKYMAGAVGRSANPAKISSDPAILLGRGAAEAAGIAKNPFIMVPGEAASYVLAKGLSDPSSQLFKVFTEGFSPATRSFVIKSGSLSAQAANSQ